MLSHNALLEVEWLKVTSLRPSTLYIGWEVSTPPDANFLDRDHWIELHPMIAIEGPSVRCKVVVDQGKRLLGCS